jgi:phosphate-selective porin OprO and OprP
MDCFNMPIYKNIPHMIFRLVLLFLSVQLFVHLNGYCQEPKDPVPDGTTGEVFRPKDSIPVSGNKTQAKLARGNEWDGTVTTMKLTVGFMYEYAGFIQDNESKQQIQLDQPLFYTRDFRFILSGIFKTKREIAWKVGMMYDGNKNAWYLRESGIAIKVPELSGHIFVGRTKEGYSMIKVMNGFSIWGMERAMDIDIIPILADGIKYYGYLPKPHLFLSFGAYSNILSKTQSFATFKWQLVSRIAVLPVYTDAYKPVLHIGLNFRYGVPKDDTLQVRSKPEVSGAPYFVDTKKFYANETFHLGSEIFYRSGPLLLGTEVNAFMAHSPENKNPIFAGGEVYAIYNFTGEVRPYYANLGIFSFLKVRKPVFNGGPGAWSAGLRYSANDLDAGAITGGRFWRITPFVTWYLSDMFSMVVAYGYGVLDKNSLRGGTQFFQTRVVFLLH